MRKRLIWILISMLMSPALFPQSPPWKGKRMKNFRPGTILASRQPVKVSGEGMATRSGVKYWDIRVGEGDPATKGHPVQVLYTAWVENGREFASSASDGKPPIFTLGAGQVIPGWEEGVEGMRVGGKRQLRIPPDLAYGATGLPPLVPPNATLIYDVELVAME